MQEKKQVIWIVGIAIVVIVAIGALAYFGRGGQTGPRGQFYEGEISLENLSAYSSCPLTEDKDAFAKCLTEKGWVMYGAEWCAHCKSQKEMFGPSFQYIKYVECPENIQLCLDKGINGYPTWVVDNP